MATGPANALPETRRHIQVRGQVQGVGFRPFVYRLATELGLGGWVRNDADGVHIEVQGEPAGVQALLDRLAPGAPALARVEAIEHRARPCEEGGRSFRIVTSGAGPVRTAVTPDSAVCAECLSELFDPAERRYRYPFINCTQCGPRYTITTALPYDRPHTSMARFALCQHCDRQYQDPADRRFHAQPLACPQCGPQLALHDAQGAVLAVDDVVAAALVRLQAGEIVALKGLGGFHLACDARNPAAVARLRARKQREEKPFALMAANLPSVAPWVSCGEAERALALGATRPIVLLRKRPGVDAALAGVAPGVAWLGVMLPYTPLHYLLFHEAVGRPAGTGWLEQPQPLVLVMTSANPRGEPLVIDNDEALRRLAGIADGFVSHERDIHQRCDDSVMRCQGDTPSFIRRARGYTPQSIRLPRAGPSVLACGAGYKNTICVTRGDQAFLSQHIGDLDNRASCDAWEEVAAHLMRVLQIEPAYVAHDLHPDLLSTRLGIALAQVRGLPAIAVQHHHAHIAAVGAEHGARGPLLGLALDGVGLGSDGAIWGGELLRVDESGFERLGGLRPLALPGGDRAAREPWRMAASALHALGRGEQISRRFPWPAAEGVRSLLERGLNCPRTSSAGRLFDAAAGLLGVKACMAFEGQAAMLLEGLAEGHGPLAPDPEGFRLAADGALDLWPLLARLADTGDAVYGAALFHATFAEALAQWVVQTAQRQGLEAVALGGGCFLNHRLSTILRARLARGGLRVYEAHRLPPNDGGLSLGQAWVAMGQVGV
jgi:hydrogenase maturation protein HypF